MKFSFSSIILIIIFSVVFPVSMKAQDKAFYSLDKYDCLESNSIWVLTYQNEYYPGHRSGIEIIQNGSRIITSLDLRIDPIPIPDGLGVAYPAFKSRSANPATGEVTMEVSYPAYDLNYTLSIKPRGDKLSFTAKIDKALSEDQPLYAMLEIYPVEYFGATWMFDRKLGTFPRQYNGKRTIDSNGDTISIPLATGKQLSVAPGDKLNYFSVESRSGELELHDGRASTNHKWFVVMEKLPARKKGVVAEWVITPGNTAGYHSSPVIGVSRTGYHPLAEKHLV
ncbi:MAG TPA: hypothetical protein VE870_08135, partial [Bacteroidales bacterium]|nr:hypothetical protein [Bacteroidales bacterium]